MDRLPDTRVSTADAVAVTPVCLLAAVVVGAWFGDLVGLPVAPWVALPLGVAAAGPVVLGLWRGAAPDRAGVAVWGIVTAITLALLLAWAWPTLLPLGSGPDLVHHLALIRYIETHRSLVHDPSAERWLGEMVSYTPGSHLLAVIGGQLAGLGGVRVVHALVALAVALKAGLVAALVMRGVLSGVWIRAAAGLMAALFLFVPRDYTLGSFAHDSYIAQVVSETFAVTAWWAIAAWDERPARPPLAVLALALVATFLTWPIWVGPLVLASAVIILARRGAPVRARVTTLALTLAPLGAVTGAYVAGRLAWVGIVKTGGAVQSPSLGGFGVSLVLLGVVGLALGSRGRRLRSTAVLLAAMVLQAIALFVVAKAHGAQTPYMAYKMFYLAAGPLAVCAAVALERTAWFLSRQGRVAPLSGRWFEAVIMTLAALIVARAVIRAEKSAPPPRPAVTWPMAQAAGWLRDRGTVDCVDYLTHDWVSAYWLHVVALGHPRVTWRTQDITDRFDRREVIGRWVDPAGDYRFAIVENLDQLPRDARLDTDVLARFGPAAVVTRRRGTTAACPDLVHTEPR